MTPASPVVPGAKFPLEETVYAKNQPPYIPLPVHRLEDGTVLSRWHMTFTERMRAFFTGDVYLWVSTFNQPLQPIKLQINKPVVG